MVKLDDTLGHASTVQRDVWLLDAHDDPMAASQYRAACAPLFDITLHDPDDAFHNRLDGYNLGGLLVGRCRGVAQTFDRTRAHIQKDGQDHVQLVIQQEGVWSGDYDGRFADRTQGSVRLVDQGRPFHVDSSAFETFNIMIPRALLGEAGDADLHGLVLSEERPAARLLTSYVRSLWEALPGLSTAEAHAAAGALPMLLTGVLTGPATLGPAERPLLPATLLSMARREIDRRLADDDLTPSNLAAQLGLGRSALYRLFEDAGGVAAFIQGRRLDKAFDALARPDKVSLATLSQAHGFKSAAHFNRAFRVRFGLPPGEMRGRLKGGDAPSATADPSVVFAWLKRL